MSIISGASLYVPATHPDLALILAGKKLANVAHIIICTEDAVAAHELNAAVVNLSKSMLNRKQTAQIRYLRPRNSEFIKVLADKMDLSAFDGFVLPKFTQDNMNDWFTALKPWLKQGKPSLMPTLETVDVFSYTKMLALQEALLASPYLKHINTLRVGGNDLLSLLRLRRIPGVTLYETPLVKTLAELVTIFAPAGFSLSAPVFEYLDDTATLHREIIQDINYGFVGKTAIHPEQVGLIESNFRVSDSDIAAAREIIKEDAKGVFKFNGAMCEAATHKSWATKIIDNYARNV